jgi:hypothetical protein
MCTGTPAHYKYAVRKVVCSPAAEGGGDVGDVYGVDELGRSPQVALNLEGHDTAEARHVLLGHVVVGVRLQAGVVHLAGGSLRMSTRPRSEHDLPAV